MESSKTPEEIRTICIELISRQTLPEFIALLEDVKKVIRISESLKSYPVFVNMLEKMGLSAEHSDFGYSLRYDGNYERVYDSPDRVFVYISKDRQLAKDAKDAESRRDDKGLGRILGFPECCTDFYMDRIKDAKVHPDFIRESHINTRGKHNHLINNCFYDSDLDFASSLVFHFPCSYSCRESIVRAKRLLGKIRDWMPDEAALMERRLKMPVIYFYPHEFFVLKGENNAQEKTQDRTENIIDYDGFYSWLGHKTSQSIASEFRWANRAILDGTTIRLFRDGWQTKSIEKPYIFLKFS